MLLTNSRTSILFGLLALPFGLAFDCTQSNAITYPPPNTSGSGSGSGSGTGDFTLEDPCLRLCKTQTCFDLCYGNKLKTRATLACTETESCFLNTEDTSLFCLNKSTGVYHDDSGGRGNVFEGVYTAADGQATTLSVAKTLSETTSTAALLSTTSAAAASPSIGTSSSSTSPSTPTISASTPVSASQTSVLVNSATTSTAGVAPTTASPTSGGERVGGRSSMYGILGLVVGLLVV